MFESFLVEQGTELYKVSLQSEVNLQESKITKHLQILSLLKRINTSHYKATEL